MAAESPIPFKVIFSEQNSGNVFAQWEKGINAASGDLIWIAEADDYCEPGFLQRLVPQFVDPSVVLAYTDSVMVDGEGKSRGAEYKTYYTNDECSLFQHSFKTAGRELLERRMLVENTIPNASAVVFRRDAVPEDLETIKRYSFSGDWWFWICVAEQGQVVHDATAMNYHRRHERSVMGKMLQTGEELLDETIRFYQRVVGARPALITSRTWEKVLQRLQGLFLRYPGLADTSGHLRDHARYTKAVSLIEKAILGDTAS